MREPVRLPQFGMGMMDGEIVEWLKAPGDPVTEEEPICLVEAVKVVVELGAPYTGTLAEIVVQVGEVVDVGTILAWIEF